MLRYILGRIGQSIIVLVGVSVLAFAVLFLSGDPTYLYVNEHATNETIIATRHKLGFDRPVYVQYYDFASKAIRGDFGK
jgi:peptide/nickel transport system permease protein